MSLPSGDYAIKIGRFQKFVGLQAKEWILTESTNPAVRPEQKTVEMIIKSFKTKFSTKVMISVQQSNDIMDYACYGKIKSARERDSDKVFGKMARGLKSK